MREARIILPKTDNDGRDLEEVYHDLRQRLAEAFGGFTISSGFGCWINDAGKLHAEDVHIFDVAMEETRANRQRLLDIAAWAAEAAHQEAVYARDAGGLVHFIQAPLPVVAAA